MAMKLPGFLDKPRWQAKDAATRRAAVAADADAELVANLPRIAREDSDPGVRITALKRLADPATAQRSANDDADPDVRARARALWFDLIAGACEGAPPPNQCRRLLQAQDDVALIEHVARNAPDEALRSSALARVTRASLLAERATSDPAPSLRLAALDRIDDEAMLDRLAERTRKTDKIVSRHARERADAMRIARGDSAIALQKARSLCERLEQIAREAHQDADIAAIETQWSRVEASLDDALRARYRAARELIAASRDAPPRASEDSKTETPAPAAMEPPPEPATEIPEAEPEVESPLPETMPDPAPLVAKARFEASLSAANASKDAEHQRIKANLEHFEQALTAFEQAIGEGSAARAHETHADLVRHRHAAPDRLPRALARRLAEAERGYAELSRWQHWSDNQRRKQLCEAVEELTGSGLHPDAVATRVREAQAEWAQLDAAEGHAHSAHPAGGWARRFHAACRHALEPAKTYFRKRQELRKTHAEEVRTALARAAEIADDSSDWTLIANARRDVLDRLRALDGVDPRDRKTFAHKLKRALKRLDALLDRRHGEVEQAKSALIAEAQALAAAPDRSAVAAARALQQRWREAGNGKRNRDQAQWKAFRAALDDVFGGLDAERAKRSARDAESREQAAALCAELEELGRGETEPPRAVVSRIETAWDALRVRDDDLRRRFTAARGAIRDAFARRERGARRAPYDHWLARYTLCRRAERAEDPIEELRAQWEAAAASDIGAAALAARFDAAASGIASAADSDESAQRDVLIRIEILAGLESPAEDRERRRALQIERLSARLSGNAAATIHQELALLLTRWSELAAASPEFEERLRRDLAAVIETLP